MRYKNITLISYAGFFDGMGLREVSIDFTRCMTNKIIIRGANGSGKSTLMNSLNVLPDPNTMFIQGAEARKIITVIDGLKEYVITYIHPINSKGERGTTKGYIAEVINGQLAELNPNGNISSCKDIIFERFNLDANFISLSQLSSENKGIVEMKPAERKKYVSSMLNVLDIYNNIYKTINKKCAVFKSTINSLTYKIDSIGDETTLNLNLSNIETVINNLDNDKSKIIEAIAGTKMKICELQQILTDNNYDAITTELDDINSKLKFLNKEINHSLQLLKIDDISKVDSYLETVNNTINKLDVEILDLRQRVPSLLTDRENEFAKLQDKQERLNSLQSDYNYLDIKNARDEALTKVNEYNELFNQMHLMNIDLITKEEFESAMESITYLKENAINLSSSYSYEDLLYTLNNINEIRNTNLMIERNKLTDLKDGYRIMEKKIDIAEAQRSIADKLINRPSECNIDSCPYIESALEADRMYPKEEFEKNKQMLLDTKNEIDNLELMVNKLEIYKSILTRIDMLDRELKSKSKFILKLPVSSDFIDTFIPRAINGDRFEDVDKLNIYADCGNAIEEYKVCKSNLDKFEAEYKTYETKNEIIENIIEDVKNLTDKTNNLAQEITDVNNLISDKEKQLQDMNIIKDKMVILSNKIKTEFIPYKDRYKELSELQHNMDNSVKMLSEEQNNLNLLNIELGKVDTEIKANSAERDKLNHSALLLQQYKEELNDYMSKYSKLDKIKYYSSPSTGIQTLFMELYMNKIISISNDLLSYLFHGEYMLQRFIINDSEFRIPCVSDRLMHDDISSMSTAQKSMISMILSFALLHQSSTKFNIIKLDEIDGALDTANREYFTTLLDNLMGLLNCEQCFIVSHNNELNSYNCDLIVLRNDTNENYAGNVIWKYN